LLPLQDSDGTQTPRLPDYRGVPTTIILSPDGLEVARFEGDTDWGDPKVVAWFKQVVKSYYPRYDGQ
jgi:hypothetical protein